jgi:hypothetical protein
MNAAYLPARCSISSDHIRCSSALLTVAMFAMHGAMYLHLKIPHGELHERIGRWIWPAWGCFLVLYMLTTIYTLVAVRGAIPNFERAPWALGQAVQSLLHRFGGEPAIGYGFLAKEGITSFCLKAVDPMFQRLRHFEASRRSAKRDRNYPFMQTVISANSLRFNDKSALEKRTLARTLNSNEARPNGPKTRKTALRRGMTEKVERKIRTYKRRRVH